ncbi:MAG: hypothetical protein JXB47_08615 [Anaerolineae bacterium]|nr:hypothetical protein [Anaerolineae bacterium]
MSDGDAGKAARAAMRARADALLGAEADDLGQHIAQAIIAFVGSKDWEAAQVVLRSYPVLLTEAADVIFAGVVAAAEDTETEGDEAGMGAETIKQAVENLRRHRQMLQWCRAEGIESAFRRVQDA